MRKESLLGTLVEFFLFEMLIYTIIYYRLMNNPFGSSSNTDYSNYTTEQRILHTILLEHPTERRISELNFKILKSLLKDQDEGR